MAEPITNYVLTDHALFEMDRRGIDHDTVRLVLVGPGQRLAVREGRDVLQSKFDMDGKTFVVRVVVDIDRDPAEIVTVYRTSRIEKYWRTKS